MNGAHQCRKSRGQRRASTCIGAIEKVGKQIEEKALNGRARGYSRPRNVDRFMNERVAEPSWRPAESARLAASFNQEKRMTKQTPVDQVFDWCVQFLVHWAKVLGITYNEINVYVFCVIWPIVTLVLFIMVVRQCATIRMLKRRLPRA
ncbi:hypothetical protein ACGLHS_09860 [Variovorax sp. VaC1]|uniref:hypothetical protein n=1 Tax=Variovorax sp. VaC1 TaxID=3373132 RepID=UPI003749B617